MKSEIQPFAAWHEGHGDVLWWRFPVTEAPYVGSPLDCGRTVQIKAIEARFPLGEMSIDVGGWPFLDCDDGTLWWEPIAPPEDPRKEGE